MLRRVVHPSGSPLCNPGLHCYEHNRDEPAVPAYVTCGECGHVFPSVLTFWLAHSRAAFRAYPWVKRNYDRRYALVFTLGCLFARPSRIYSCPHCSHDL